MKSPRNKKLQSQVKKTTKSAIKVGDNVGENFEKHIASRWSNLQNVRRFVATWLLLVTLLSIGVFIQNQNLSALYQTEVASDGGVFIEGTVGEISNLNPIFARSPTDSSAARLLFNGLFRYDDENNLEGDLAESYEVNEDGTVYTVVLKDTVFWHDGTPVTADDVIFTIRSIQHPDTRSPLNASWQDVTAQKIDDRTVNFVLSNPFTPFVHSLTVPLIPNHILGDVPPIELRAHPFNLQPEVGTGPFVFSKLALDETTGQIETNKNESYHRGEPRLDKFIIQAFQDHESMIAAFEAGELTAIAGLRSFDFDSFDDLETTNADFYDLPLYNSVMTFFKMSDEQLKDKAIRRALTLATDRETIFTLFDSRYAIGQGPLLPSQLGYDAEQVQDRFDLEAARKVLDEAKWAVGDDGFREKAGVKLELSLVAQRTGEFPQLAEELQRQWAEIGVKLNAQLVSPEDLQQTHIVPHNYQILLANVVLGIDPDVFVYWHSSQATVRGFNFSELKNDDIDQALEAGRTRIDDELRVAKYKAFLQEWRKQYPAVALYQPAFAYVQDSAVRGYRERPLLDPTDRFLNVQDWTINTITVTR